MIHTARAQSAEPGSPHLRAAPPTSRDPNDPSISPEALPPEESIRERRGLRLAAITFCIWAGFLLLMWLVPALGLWERCVVILDVLLWPIIAGLGRFGGVALIAGGTAFLSLVAQFFLTDVRRLRRVKRCSRVLRDEIYHLPKDCPRDKVLFAALKRAHWRIARAGLVPLAVFLGPMVTAFLWLPVRVGPEYVNPAPGAAVTLTGTFDAAAAGMAELRAPAGVEMSSAVSQSLPAGGQVHGPDPGTLTWSFTLPPESVRLRLSLEYKPSDAAGSSHPASMPFDVITDEAAPPPHPIKLQGDQVAASLPAARPLTALTLTYADPRPAEARAFWRPFEWAKWSWDAGWLGLYMVVYLPVMFLSRRLLRIP